MSDFLERIGKLSPKRLALLALELNEQVEAAKRRSAEPLAVVGMACRFPGGADDLGRFWALLRDGKDAIRQVPPDRWDMDRFYDADPEAPSGISTRNGGFLDRIDGFDAAFFGISPREAITMDPQQRLLLEVSWEALEHAGIAPESLAGSDTGVFVGICNSDHFQRVIQRGSDSIDAYLASGNAHSVAAGRVAYFMGLQGPALAIDTACSSSLVALHVACQSLRSGETRVALAGGVNVMCSPETTIALTKARMLAPDGRCKAFDAAADGFSRGEGCGVLVLKRLGDAEADGDRILALIRGTATNQDGRSGGLTVPNGPAQEAVIRAALSNADAQPDDIDYVEAHGTGTSLGDPIEVRALAGALGQGRPGDRPLLIGSVKTNLGHLESAAGIAGVIKVILSLEEQQIPPHLHFRDPSPRIAWPDYPVTVAADGKAWPRGGRRRLAGVSSFGFSGTNAHVIIEEAPSHVEVSQDFERPLHCLALSARSDGALRQMASRHAAALSSTQGVAMADAAHTAGVGRSHFGERLAVSAASAGQAAEALAAFGRGESHPALQRGTADPGRPLEVVFLFTGQGAQYAGMSRALYEASPVFRDVIDHCDEVLGADAHGWTLKSVLWPPSKETPIHETGWTQPALFALEYALTQLWRSWGVEPAAAIGHSVGEYVAACVAGVFSLDEGLKLIAARGRLMQGLPAGGAMAAVFASAEEVEPLVAPMADRLSIAAINAPDSVVVSGDADAVASLLSRLEERNIQGQRLLVSLAAHSPLMDAALDAMQACAASVAMQAPRIPIAWNLTGGPLPGGPVPDATYWRRHLREPVRFADGIARMHSDGYRVFLEVGPHPTLLALAQRSLPEDGTLLLTSLRRGREDWQEMTNSLAALYVQGASIDWTGVDRPYRRRRLSLPSYPFERQSFWISAAAQPMPLPALRGPASNRLLGHRLPTAVPTFECILTADATAYLDEHRLHGTVLVAGPVFLEMAQAAAREVMGSTFRSVEQFLIREPLRLAGRGRTVQTHLGESGDGATTFSIHSRAVEGGGDWQLHATGRLVADDHAVPVLGEPAVAVTSDDEDETGGEMNPPGDSSDFYRRLVSLGIDLGPRFRSMREVRRRDGEALVSVSLPGECAGDVAVWAHPVLLDGAFQAVGMAVPVDEDSRDVYLLSGVASIRLERPLPDTFRCHVRLRAAESPRPREWLADVDLHTPDGTRLGRLQGVSLRRASLPAAETSGAPVAGGLFYRTAWEECPPAGHAAAHLQGPASFAAHVAGEFEALASRHGMDVYGDLLPELDRLSRDHIVVALHRLGFDATIGRTFSAAGEAARLGVADRHVRLFGRLLEVLVEDGFLERRQSLLAVATRLDVPAPEGRYEALAARFGEVDGELRMLRRCGSQIAQVLRGDQDPLQLLFPGGAFEEARKLYVESPYARTYNGALVAAIRAAIGKLPSASRLRILEIGGGTGGSTSFVLPLLPADRVEYTFTDVSPLFLERATQRFSAYPFLTTALLDIERPPAEQGLSGAVYDIVIAANVVHATADLGATLRHIREVLAPQGLLLLLEGVARERWVDLTFGLTEGWWRFTDHDLRPDYPLIDCDTWLALLERSGFCEATALPGSRTSGRGEAQQALLMARAPRRQRKWVLIGGEAGIAESLCRRLAERGDPVARLPVGTPVAALTQADTIVYLAALELAARGLDEPAAPDASACLACSAPLDLFAQIARDDFRGQLWLATRGVHPLPGPRLSEAIAADVITAGIDAADVTADVDVVGSVAAGAHWQAPLWGAGRVFALEHPDQWGGLVDLPPLAGDDEQADVLLAAIDGDDGEDQTAWRNASRFVLRLTPAETPSSDAAGEGLELRSDATYLITGAFGGLGQVVARWMAQRGARHLALLGRRPDPHAPFVRELEGLGVRIHSLQADVADEAAMTSLMSGLACTAPALRGIVHAAADLSAAPIADLTARQVEAMLRPKLHGAMLLERLSRTADLDFTVLFSTTTALLGAAGLAHYAAANAFLDTLATRLDRPDRRVLSVNWGTWDVMRLASSEQQRTYREGGLLSMSTAEALLALEQVLGGGDANPMVARIDWQVLKPLHEARRRRPLLARLGGAEKLPASKEGPDLASGTGAQAGSTSAPDLVARLARTPMAARRDVLVDFVSGEVATVLGLDSRNAVAPATGLFDLGMDSLMSVELKGRLERGTGKSLPSTLTFNYPNVAALSSFLMNLMGASPGDAEPAAAVPQASGADDSVGEVDLDAFSEIDLDALSDDEIESRLLARMEQSQ